MNERFLRIARMLESVSVCMKPGHDWALHPDTAVQHLALALRAHLKPVGRIVLAGAALQALDREDAVELAETVLTDACHGFPLPHPRSIAAEASSWAANATRTERIAVAAAIWQRLGERDRAGFLTVAA